MEGEAPPVRDLRIQAMNPVLRVTLRMSQIEAMLDCRRQHFDRNQSMWRVWAVWDQDAPKWPD